jgi:hypothetical protein
MSASPLADAHLSAGRMLLSANACQSPGRPSPVSRADVIVSECLPVPRQALTCQPGGCYCQQMPASPQAGPHLSAGRMLLSANACQSPGRPSPVCQADIIVGEFLPVGECLPVLDQALTCLPGGEYCRLISFSSWACSHLFCQANIIVGECLPVPGQALVNVVEGLAGAPLDVALGVLQLYAPRVCTVLCAVRYSHLCADRGLWGGGVKLGKRGEY